MSIKYNSPRKNEIFAQAIQTTRSELDPTLYEGTFIVEDDPVDGFKLYLSDGTTWISVSSNADFAEDANTAQFAFSAQEALTAEVALIANSADTANFANFASVATEAVNANTANSADLANNSNLLQGAPWENPNVIGDSIANSAFFTEVTVTGDLTVANTINFVNVDNIEVDNNFIVLNSNQATPLVDIGFILQRYDPTSVANTNVVLAWKENNDEFVIGTTIDTEPAVSVNITEEWLSIADGTVTVANTLVANTVDLTTLVANNTAGTDTQVLFTTGTNAYWGDLPASVVETENDSTDVFFPLFYPLPSGPLDLSYTSTNLAFVPNTGLLSSTSMATGDMDISGTLSVDILSANGSLGTNGQVLTTDGAGIYWADSTGGGTGVTLEANNTVDAVYYFPMSFQPTGVWTDGVVADTGIRFNPSTATLTVTEVEVATANVAALSANGSLGNAGDILRSDGTDIYWSDGSGVGSQLTVSPENAAADPHFLLSTTTANGVITEARVSNFGLLYIPQTSTLFAENMQVATNADLFNVTANTTVGAPGQVLTSGGSNTVYWSTIPSGSTGFTGSQGLIGPQGPTGNIGFTGSEGTDGNDGFTGSRGVTGSIGFTGSRGFTGSIGFIGSASTVPGFDGSRGFTGSRGTDGTSIQVLGTVATPAALPPGPNNTGDSYVTENTGDLWTWSGSAWVNVGRFVGFTGSQGFVGSRGFTGSEGPIGFVGSDGFVGSRGFTGSEGPQGVPGPIGSRGFNGSRGFDGSRGFTGSQGADGNAGTQGIQGPPGTTGPQGFTGSEGSGFTGSAGSLGFTGSRGFTGSQGPAGPQGADGNAGTLGFTGSRGNNGFTGSVGLTGGIGPQGNNGFTGSRGTDGVVGGPGPQGFTGSRGNLGATGLTGSRGNNGSAGATGAQGNTGFTGSRGNTGPTGATGATGPAGSTGPQGPIGFTGSGGTILSTSSQQMARLGVGTAPGGSTGEIRATNNITAYFSDDRLKTRVGDLDNALEKVTSLSGFIFEPNETAMELGYENKRDVGVSAQAVQKILPEIVVPAPVDENYMTVRYEKLIPLLIEAIKDLNNEVTAIKNDMIGDDIE